MPEFLPEEVKAATTVDLQPFIRADDGMVFRVLPPGRSTASTSPSPGRGRTELRSGPGDPTQVAVTETLDWERSGPAGWSAGSMSRKCPRQGCGTVSGDRRR